MKKSLSLFIILTMIFCLTLPAFATDIELSRSAASASFIEICDLFFAGKGEAFTQNGTNVTEEFYSSYIEAYSSGAYDAIKAGCISSGVSCIKVRDVSSTQTRLEMTRTYNEMSYHLITQQGYPYDGKTWGFVVQAVGSFTYHDSTLQIASYTAPRLIYSFDGLGAAFTGAVTESTVSIPTLINGRTTLKFSAEVRHEVYVPIPGIDLLTGTIGPFDTISVFEISI